MLNSLQALRQTEHSNRRKMKFLDFEAHIVVDGEKLPEYNVEYDEKTKSAVCWVPSQAGKSFSVTGMPSRRSDVDVAARMYADGAYVMGVVFRKGRSWTPGTWSGASTSATTYRPLMFACIELTDDDTLLNHANLKELGEITMRIFRVEITSEDTPFSSHETSSLNKNQIHERSKKAVAHKINLGAEITEPARTFLSTKDLEKLCNLTFKYRSIDVLRADGIAPPASVSPAADGKRKALDDDDGEDDQEQDSDEADQEEEQDKAQLKALLEQINTLEAKMAKKGTNARSKKKVKTENHTTFIPGEVIDLTL